jgi:hypothetical protein
VVSSVKLVPVQKGYDIPEDCKVHEIGFKNRLWL